MKTIITGDEKWVINNIKKSWSKKNQPKPIQRPKFTKRGYALFWWNFKGIILFDLLPDNTMVNSEVHCNQLDKFNYLLKYDQNLSIEIVFHHDNARPLSNLATRQSEWMECITTPTIFSKFGSFRLLFVFLFVNFLKGKTCTLNQDVKYHLDQFLASKDQKIYEASLAQKIAKGIGSKWRIYKKQRNDYSKGPT